MRKVEVVSYDPRWPARFEEEARRLGSVFGRNLVAIHHVGSTAVPGLPAKPTLDLLPVVRDIRLVDDAAAAMLRLGYEARGGSGISGRRYFVRELEGQRTHHVHVFEEGHPAVAEHLLFRDYLRAHPERARRYGALKVRLARRLAHDSRGYSEGKAPLVRELLQEALAWRPGSVGT